MTDLKPMCIALEFVISCSCFKCVYVLSILFDDRSEANDLALRLARAYTKKHDVIVIDKYV